MSTRKNKSGMGKQGKSGGMGAGSDTQSQIDALKQQLADLMQQDYTGRKGWGKQLESRVNKANKIRSRIEKLEREQAKTTKPEPAKPPKEKPAAPTWCRAGEGWYVGPNGHEIRESDSGGFDIVKVSGGSETTVKHFAKLADARKYNP